MQIKGKNVVSGIVFLLGLAVLLAVVSLFFQPKNNTEVYGMEDQKANGILGEPEQTIDVLFLGDSVSYCSIIPMQIWRDYGITSYLCGTSLQKLYYSREFLYKTFKTQSPKVVFLGTAVLFHDFAYTEDARAVVEQTLPVFRYHDRWKGLDDFLQQDFNVQVEYTHQEVTKGYYYSGASQEIDVGDYTRPTDVIEYVPDNCKKMLTDIKEFCEERGAKLVLLSEPNAAGAWGPHRHNGIALVAEELGLEYLDINYAAEKVQINWSVDSFDSGDHLNYSGAQKVTAYLGEYLWNMGIFEDKRANEQYEVWNETQKLFYEAIGK